MPNPIIVDTNTIISSVLKSGSVTDLAFEKAISHYEIYFSDETWLELVDVIHRKKFAKYLTPHRIDLFIETLSRTAIFSGVTHHVTACRDPKDNKFLSLGLSIGACCIITGDDDLLVLNPFEGIEIITPSDFLRVKE